MISQKVAQGAAWLTIARFIRNSVQTIGTLIVAGILSPEDFGIVSIAMSWKYIVESFTNLPVRKALVQKPQISEFDYNAAFTLKVIRGAIVSAFILIVLCPLSFFLKDTAVLLVLLVVAFEPLILGFESQHFSKYERNLKFFQYAALIALGTIAHYVVTIPIAIMTESYLAIAAGTLGTAFTWLIGSRLWVKERPRLVKLPFGEVWKFTFWYSLSGGAGNLSTQLNNIIVGKILGISIVGFLSVATTFVSGFVTLFHHTYTRAVFAAFSRVNSDRKRFQSSYLFSQNIYMMHAVPIGITISFLAGPIVHTSLGDEWLQVIPILQVFGITNAFYQFATPAKMALASTGRTKFLFMYSSVIAFGSLLISVLAAYYGGIDLLIKARGATLILLISIYAFMIKKELYISYTRQFIANLNVYFSSIMLFASYSFINNKIVPESISHFDHIVLLICSGTIVFPLSLFIFWTANGKSQSAHEVRLFSIISKYIKQLFAWRQRTPPPSNATPID